LASMVDGNRISLRRAFFLVCPQLLPLQPAGLRPLGAGPLVRGSAAQPPLLAGRGGARGRLAAWWRSQRPLPRPSVGAREDLLLLRRPHLRPQRADAVLVTDAPPSSSHHRATEVVLVCLRRLALQRPFWELSPANCVRRALSPRRNPWL
jgi:hypothetical protein